MRTVFSLWLLICMDAKDIHFQRLIILSKLTESSEQNPAQILTHIDNILEASSIVEMKGYEVE